MRDVEIDFSLSPRQSFNTANARYKVIERAGQGGNSNVYVCQAASGVNQGQLFAAKFMVNVAKRDRVARFQNELDFLQRIDYPGITRVFDSGTLTFGSSARKVDVPFYVAEYLPKTLRDSIRAGMLMVDKVAVALQLISTLAYLAHSDRNVIHRDIKPENIFFRGRSAVLGDFGLLKVLEPSELSEHFDIGSLSRGVRHPFFYPTPELIAYAKDPEAPVCCKSDVFQLGLVLAELFCGAHPIKSRSEPLDPIELEKLEQFPGSNAASILGSIEKMLEIDVARRVRAEDLIDRWEGVFYEVINDAQRLEGRAFW